MSSAEIASSNDLPRDGTGDRLPRASIPLSVVVSPSASALRATVSHALAQIPLDIVAVDPPLSGGDPRLVTDLAVLECSRLGSALESALYEARTRWPTSMIICYNASTETLASKLLETGADIALREDVSAKYVRGVISAAGRRLTVANALLRVTYGDLVFDRDARRVWCAGKPVSLTERELQLVQYLFLHAGHAVSPATLLACAWRVDPAIASNGLAVYIGYLRRKLSKSRLVELATVRGEGYSLRLRSETGRFAHRLMEATEPECIQR